MPWVLMVWATGVLLRVEGLKRNSPVSHPWQVEFGSSSGMSPARGFCVRREAGPESAVVAVWRR
jgi:hypothetical protein